MVALPAQKLTCSPQAPASSGALSLAHTSLIGPREPFWFHGLSLSPPPKVLPQAFESKQRLETFVGSMRGTSMREEEPRTPTITKTNSQDPALPTVLPINGHWQDSGRGTQTLLYVSQCLKYGVLSSGTPLSLIYQNPSTFSVFAPFLGVAARQLHLLWLSRS